MGRWLILGALLAATLQTFVSQSTLLAIGSGPIVSVLVLMALAVLLSVCSTVDAFLALALSATFAPGALLAFLVFGPMIDIKRTLMFLTTLSTRAVAWIVGLVVPLVVVAGVMINLSVTVSPSVLLPFLILIPLVEVKGTVRLLTRLSGRTWACMIAVTVPILVAAIMLLDRLGK